MASTRAKRAAEAASGRDKAAKTEQSQATAAEQQNGEVQKRRRSPSPVRRDDKRRRTASPQVRSADRTTSWCHNIRAQGRCTGTLATLSFGPERKSSVYTMSPDFCRARSPRCWAYSLAASAHAAALVWPSSRSSSTFVICSCCSYGTT